MVGWQGILPYLVFWALVSTIHAQASKERCDIKAYGLVNPSQTINNFPICENFGQLQPGETECSDRCYCHWSVGSLDIKDDCSLKHFKQTVVYEGAILKKWHQPTLDLDYDVIAWVGTYVVLAFDSPPPQIKATRNSAVCRRREYAPVLTYAKNCGPYNLVVYTGSVFPIDDETKKQLRAVYQSYYHEVDCLVDKNAHLCTSVAGDITLNENDLVIPHQWRNVKTQYGCIKVINSPIKCEDLRAFVDGLSQNCYKRNEIRNSPNIESVEKCVGRRKGWSFTPVNTTTEEPSTEKPVIEEHTTEPTGTNPDVVVVTAIAQKPTVGQPTSSSDDNKNPNDHSNFVFNILILAIVLLLVAIAYWTISLRNKKPLQDQKDGKLSIEQMVAAQLENGIKPELLKNLTTV